MSTVFVEILELKGHSQLVMYTASMQGVCFNYQVSACCRGPVDTTAGMKLFMPMKVALAP